MIGTGGERCERCARRARKALTRVEMLPTRAPVTSEGASVCLVLSTEGLGTSGKAMELGSEVMG